MQHAVATPPPVHFPHSTRLRAGAAVTRSASAAIAAVMILIPAAAGASSITSFEANIVAAHSESEGWTGEVPGSQRNSIGFEHVARFSGERGDFLTVNLQARLTYDTSTCLEDAVALELHNAYAEWRIGLGRGLRLGHFAPEFGAEPSLDTHGTLLQSLAIRSLGFKKDWGVGYRAALGPLDLGVSAQIGSGMGIQRRDGSYLVSARVGTPTRGNGRVGASMLVGRVLSADAPRLYPSPRYSPSAAHKVRVCVDGQYVAGPLTLIGEAVAGRDENLDVLGGLLRADVTGLPIEKLVIKCQVSAWTDDLGDEDRLDSGASLVAEYAITSGWTLRGLISTPLGGRSAAETASLAIQAYFIGG